MTDPRGVRIALAGAGGFGRTHLDRLRQLHGTGRARLIAVCDPSPPSGEVADWLAAESIPVFADFDHMVCEMAPDVVVIATPPHRHATMLRTAVSAGADVLVEKPPVVTRSQLEGVLGDSAGRLCQVGFQALGSWAVPRLRQLIESGDLGPVDRVSAGGCWVRGDRYYARARWSGRKVLDGWPVNDGALTNPFAHAVMSCLAVSGVDSIEGARVAADLYRAHDIEVHDTGSMRVEAPGRPTVLVAVTLCAGASEDPWLTVQGEWGRARWEYLSDSIEVQGPRGARVESGPRTDLLENLLSVRSGQAPELLAPLSETRGFVELTEFLSAAPVQEVGTSAVRRCESDGDSLVEIVGVEASTRHATEEGLLYRETEAPWTVAPNN